MGNDGKAQTRLGWLQKYLAFTYENEAPEIYHLWSGITILAHVLGRKVRLDRGYFTTYPGQMLTFLVGPPATRKSTAIDIATELLRELPDVNIIANKLSAPILLDSLDRGMVIDPKDGTGKPADSIGFVSASELSVFLPKIAYVEEIIPILTDLFDGKKSFRQKTRSGGLIELTNPLITMLAGSTADWLETNIPVNAYGGGFLSRIIFVYANRKSKDVPLPELTPKIKRLRLELAAELTWINANMGGDVVWTPEAKEWYVRFYGSWDPNDDPGNSVQKGYRNRRTEHLLRVAIVFAVSQKRNLILDVDALVAADEALKIIEVHMAKCFENAAPQMAFSKTYRMVLDFIEEKGPCTKRQITRALWRHINAAELSMCIQTLDDAGLIKTTTSGQTITYEYQPMKIP
jgi:hypothetical protein